MGFKTKIYPTKEQIEYFNKCFGIDRFVFNWYLYNDKKYYAQGNRQSYYDLREKLIQLKHTPKFNWLMTANDRILNCSMKNAKMGLDKFFKKLNRYPNYKTKKSKNKSFSCERCLIDSNSTKLKRFKHLFNGFHFYIAGEQEEGKRSANGYFIKTAEDITFLKNKTIKKITISYDGIDYYVSFSYENSIIDYNGHIVDVVGIDLGLKKYSVQSDNRITVFPKQRVFKLEKRIKRLKSILNQKEKGSNNYNKVKTKLRKSYRKITNIVLDFLHKYTTYICKNYKTIKIEDLTIKKMLKNHNLAKAIHRSCWRKFRNMLQYKSLLYNNNLIIVDSYFPSSKTCYYCRNKKQDLKLSDRIYHCNVCGYENDRDLNAAYNLREWI
jgi:putative transposase